MDIKCIRGAYGVYLLWGWGNTFLFERNLLHFLLRLIWRNSTMQLDTSFMPEMFAPGFYERNFPPPRKAFHDARLKLAARESGMEANQVANFQADMETERTEERDEINDINEAITIEIEEGNTSQMGEDTKGGKTSSPVIEIDSNSPAITQGSVDLMGSLNGMETNEEGVTPHTEIITENLFDIQVNHIEADLEIFDNNHNSGGETARAFNAITTSVATQLQPTSQRPTHKSHAPLMKHSNASAKAKNTINPTPTRPLRTWKKRTQINYVANRIGKKQTGEKRGRLDHPELPTKRRLVSNDGESSTISMVEAVNQPRQSQWVA